MNNCRGAFSKKRLLLKRKVSSWVYCLVAEHSFSHDHERSRSIGWAWAEFFEQNVNCGPLLNLCSDETSPITVTCFQLTFQVPRGVISCHEYLRWFHSRVCYLCNRWLVCFFLLCCCVGSAEVRQRCTTVCLILALKSWDFIYGKHWLFLLFHCWAVTMSKMTNTYFYFKCGTAMDGVEWNDSSRHWRWGHLIMGGISWKL